MTKKELLDMLQRLDRYNVEAHGGDMTGGSHISIEASDTGAFVLRKDIVKIITEILNSKGHILDA